MCVCVYKCVCFFLSPDKEMDPERESGLPKVMWPASGSARHGLHTSGISLGLFLSYLHLNFPKSRLRIHSFFEGTLKLVGLNKVSTTLNIQIFIKYANVSKSKQILLVLCPT